ncbi:hypothetical protein BS47DRAFT_1356576 [Hydnum rufescens UP504]|uniref:Protein kinase domain-containing protein n=1 Tax=Hydnum rufescens UP504 TaxID=1448309 RepID=A0A9P6AB67_9AGAM|nr:hypothetical protein BS47DRAFT_1356576 [Hydnum rufescens UP504]
MKRPASPVFDHDSKAPRAIISSEPFTGTVIRFHNEVVATLKEIVYRQYALIGRGACAFRGEVNGHSDLSGKDLMVKISWPSQWRTTEVKFLEAARSYALSQNDEHILGHIPQVFLHQDFYSTVDGPRGNCAFVNDDHQVLRVIVMDSYFPMTQLHTAPDFSQVIIDVVKRHRGLHDGAKILHRDISMNNIMFRRGENNRVIGVLIDFDLAVFVKADPDHVTVTLHLDRRFRTGTAPFMAIDLLEENDKIHWVRHDLESVLWVIIWYTARYHEGIETTMAFQIWRKSDMARIAVQKARLFTKARMYEPTEHFLPLAVWVRPLLRMFAEGQQVRDEISYKAKYGGGQTSETGDLETLGGHITYQTFLHILGEA